MKINTTVHKYRKNDGTKVRTHNRKIDVDVFKPENKEDSFENKDSSPSINIDKSLVQGSKLKFKGSCDRFRQTKEGEGEWHKMMETKKEISEKEFLNKINIKDILDEDEKWEDYKINSQKEGDPIKFYKSNNNTYFFQTAGFEFIWK